MTRWDRAFPQYEVGHLLRVARVEEEVAALGGLAVAGAALRGRGHPRLHRQRPERGRAGSSASPGRGSGPTGPAGATGATGDGGR